MSEVLRPPLETAPTPRGSFSADVDRCGIPRPPSEAGLSVATVRVTQPGAVEAPRRLRIGGHKWVHPPRWHGRSRGQPSALGRRSGRAPGPGRADTKERHDASCHYRGMLARFTKRPTTRRPSEGSRSRSRRANPSRRGRGGGQSRRTPGASRPPRHRSVSLALLRPSPVEEAVLPEDVGPKLPAGQVGYEGASVHGFVAVRRQREASLVGHVPLSDVPRGACPSCDRPIPA